MHFLLMLPECFFFLFETKENTRVGESHDVVVIAFKKLHTKTLSRRSQSLLACSRLSVSGGLKKRAGDDEWGLVGKERGFIIARSLFRSSSLTESQEQAKSLRKPLFS